MPDASGFVGFASGLTAEGSPPQPYDIAVDIAYQAEVVGALPAPVAAGALVRPTSTTSGVALAANTDTTGSAVASVLTEDLPAPADPVGMFNMGTARAEGAGFPAVAPGDGVTEQMTVAGVPLVAGAAPDGSRYTDVDRQGDAAPATPAGPYTVGTARAEGAGFPAVVAGQAVAGQSTVSGLPLLAVSAPDGSRFADVDAEDDVAPADPRGTYPLGVAQIEGGAGAGVVAGDAVANRSSTAGVPYIAQAASDLSRVADIDAEDDVAPADPRGAYPLGVARATSGVAFPVVSADGDATATAMARSGIAYCAPTAEDGSRSVSIGQNDAAAPANLNILPGGGKVVTALPALTEGDWAQDHHNVEGSKFVVTRSSSDEATPIAAEVLLAGAKSTIQPTSISGFIDVGFIVSATADTDIDILIGQNAARVGYWQRVSLILAQNERIVAVTGVPLWANQVQVRTSAAATVTLTVERSR